MSYNRKQFEDLIRRILTWCDPALCSDSAVNLLLGTAAQESKFGTYLRQIKGPALGAYQMEPATFDWLQRKFEGRYKWLVGCLASEMEHDLLLATIMCRLRYKVVPEPLPIDPNDIPSLAHYYKIHYNTPAGKATEEQFIENYHLYVKGA